MECGHLPEEIGHALAGRHTYAEVRIFGDLTLVLCDFCRVDFGSFDPDVFGMPKGARIGYEKIQFLRDVEEIRIGKDKVCPQCRHRLPFLRFVQKAREVHGCGHLERRA
jgi:hypothetical protein